MIGTGSIIVMISLGLATDAQFAQMIEDMNLDMTVINVYPQWGGMMWSPDGGMEELTQRDLTDESADRISRLPNVRVATPMMQQELLFRSGPYTMLTQATGIRADALEGMGLNLIFGRLFEEGEEFAAVFCTAVERGFFDATDRRVFHSPRLWDDDDDTELVDIYNDDIRIYYDTSRFWNSRDWGWGWGGGGGMDDDVGMDIDEAMTPLRSFDIEVVGVIEEVNSGMWGRGMGTVYMDIETLQTINQMSQETQRRAQEENEWYPQFSAVQGGPRQTYDQLFVRVNSIDHTRDVAEEIREMGYSVHFQGDWIEQQRDMQRGVQTLLAAIAAVSLAVAAINIANTMITSVTERTREIGVMKVIGASISDIRKLFLLEAITIGFLGGLFGVGLALGFSYAMNNFDIEFFNNLNMGVPDWMMMATGTQSANISLITPWLCLLALAVACGVGLVSGFYPAWRATRLSALAAIRGD
jgi:ABC-type lipoprotein release transport system permease subunit